MIYNRQQILCTFLNVIEPNPVNSTILWQRFTYLCFLSTKFFKETHVTNKLNMFHDFAFFLNFRNFNKNRNFWKQLRPNRTFPWHDHVVISLALSESSKPKCPMIFCSEKTSMVESICVRGTTLARLATVFVWHTRGKPSTLVPLGELLEWLSCLAPHSLQCSPPYSN